MKLKRKKYGAKYNEIWSKKSIKKSYTKIRVEMTLKVSYIVAMKELPPIPTPTVVPETPAPLDEVSARVLAQRIAPEAVRQLYNIGCDPEAKAAARVSALGKIVDLAEGKEQNEGNYTIIINQINRALGLKDVTPQDS